MQIEFLSSTEAFQTEHAKVNYALSFLKGMALDYFELFPDTPDNEPAWLKDYELFVEELLINFGPYNALTDAEAELNVLIMKDSHKVTRFFVDIFQLSMLCDYNNRALLQKAYSALLKRVKDEMTILLRSRNSRTWYSGSIKGIGSARPNLPARAAPLPKPMENSGTSPSSQNRPMKHLVPKTIKSLRNRHKRDHT